MFAMLCPNLLLQSLSTSDDSKEQEMNVQTQNEIYSLAIQSISKILISNKSCQHLFLEAAESKFPIIKMPEPTFLGYLKNMIILADRCTPVSQELWIIIIKRMLQIDVSFIFLIVCNNFFQAIISKSTRNTEDKFTTDNTSLFSMDEDVIKSDTLTKELEIDLTVKLDKAMTMVLGRVSKGRSDISLEENKWLNSIEMETNSDVVFEQLWPAFLELTLPAYDVQSVSFIWFYMCSFEEKYLNTVIRILWNLVSMPSLAPNEWRRSQNAATFIGAFLARATYVDFDKAYRWMQKMADWCNEYINVAGLRKTVEGCLQHGTFYAVVQSLLFVFTYRYKEFVDNNRVQDVHSWGLQRIIHSQFQPLRFISRVIALGFATISRQLQIVYCSHIVEETSEKSPIEHYLPFSIFQLPVSSSIVVPFIRKFQPTEEDTDQIAIDFIDNHKKNDMSGDDDFDFMDDDEDMKEQSAQTMAAAVLSTSPYSVFAATVTRANYITHH